MDSNWTKERNEKFLASLTEEERMACLQAEEDAKKIEELYQPFVAEKNIEIASKDIRENIDVDKRNLDVGHTNVNLNHSIQLGRRMDYNCNYKKVREVYDQKIKLLEFEEWLFQKRMLGLKKEIIELKDKLDEMDSWLTKE